MSLSHGRSFCLTNFFLRPSDRRLLVQRCCISFFRSFLSINWIMRTKSLFRRKEGRKASGAEQGKQGHIHFLLYYIQFWKLCCSDRTNDRPTCLLFYFYVSTSKLKGGKKRMCLGRKVFFLLFLETKRIPFRVVQRIHSRNLCILLFPRPVGLLVAA